MIDYFIEFYNSTLDFLKSISPILWISFILSVIFYIGNRIQKGFEIDRDIKLINGDLAEYNPENLLLRSSGSPNRMEWGEMTDKYAKKKREAGVKLEYLRKLKKYRWFFIKKFE
ncbi:MAG: hypothetical protein HY764_03790 [Candidatus Portnoybacteria bacterium]|nr:hypothetical protein [Candidatus Portnoybacteria bacterium]